MCILLDIEQEKYMTMKMPEEIFDADMAFFCIYNYSEFYSFDMGGKFFTQVLTWIVL